MSINVKPLQAFNAIDIINNETPAGAKISLSKIAEVPNISQTEIGYLDGVTSSIQTQLNGKAATAHTHAIADVTNLQTSLSDKFNKADVLSQSKTIDLVEIAAMSTLTDTIIVTGAATVDSVIVTPQSALTGKILIYGYVSAADTVTVVFQNIDNSAGVDPASVVVKALVIKNTDQAPA